MPTLNSNLLKISAYFVLLAMPLIFLGLKTESYMKAQDENDEPRSHRERYSEIFTRSVDASVIILGASNSAHGIAPAKFHLGKKVYNFSFNGASSTFNLALYRNYLKKHYRKPEYVIYAVSPGSFEKFYRKIEDDVKFLPLREGDELNSLIRIKDLKIYNSKTVALEILKFKMKDLTSEHRIGIDIRTYDNGFVEFNLWRPFVLEKNKSVVFEPDEVAATFELFTEIKADQAKLIIVALPFPFEQFHENDLVTYNRIIAKLSQKFDAPVARAEDVAPEVSKNYEYFNDQAHLTGVGAQLYSEKLGQYLKKLVH